MHIIATLTINNVSGLALYEIDDETALIGLNDKRPKEYYIEYNDEDEPFVKTEWGDYKINDFIRTEINV